MEQETLNNHENPPAAKPLLCDAFIDALPHTDEKTIDKYTKQISTEKPTKLYKWLLKMYATDGMKILDTHLGSGSIAIACHDYGFDLTACELDKEYFDKAMERIKNHTNQQKLF